MSSREPHREGKSRTRPGMADVQTGTGEHRESRASVESAVGLLDADYLGTHTIHCLRRRLRDSRLWGSLLLGQRINTASIADPQASPAYRAAPVVAPLHLAGQQHHQVKSTRPSYFSAGTPRARSTMPCAQRSPRVSPDRELLCRFVRLVGNIQYKQQRVRIIYKLPTQLFKTLGTCRLDLRRA